MTSSTLVEKLRNRAQQHPQRRALTFLGDGETETATLTYAELDARAQEVAAQIQARTEPGARVTLLFPAGLDYVAAFWGCLYAGAVAVPLYPPRPHRTDERLSAVIADCQPTLALTTDAIAARLQSVDLPPLVLDAQSKSAWRETDLNGETLAFLQYTSGSTATPKGVMVSHANVLANHRMIAVAFEQTEDFTIVSWLPLFHDMGLIGNLLQGLLAGNHCVTMAPEAFLMKPVRWLRAIARYGARASGGPNFAYDLCARKIAPQQCEGLDLSVWELAFCGAEPVRAQTLARFAEVFAPCGFAKSAFYPCYGLAEATLFAAGGSKNAAPFVASFDAAQLESGRAQTVGADAANARTLVSCGRAWLDGEVWIVDPNSHLPRAHGEIGEIWLRGPHIARGYWNCDAETRAVFGAHAANGDGPFLRTGDLGFMLNGELFPTGRLKDLIIIGGRNHAAGDIEATVEASHAALRLGGSAAFGIDVENSEVLAVVAEVERGFVAAPDCNVIVGAIRRAVAEKHDLRAHTVQLIRAATLPKTSSGKVRRRACRERLLAGTLALIEGEAPF